MKLRICQAQVRVSPLPEKIQETLEKACAYAASQKADLLMLPEMFCCPYETTLFPQYAQREGGEVWSACSEAAGKYGIYLEAGSMPEQGQDGRIYNTAYVFDRQGRQIAKHRKMHLFDIAVRGGQCFQESATLSPGNQMTVFDTEFGRMGLCICYDFRFPELCRLMALSGAFAVLVPAAFNRTTGPLHWELMFRSQAMYNQVFALGCAPALDKEAAYKSWGHSIAVDPWGRVMAQMEDTEGFQVVELDTGMAEEVRDQLPLLRHRRTDLYDLRFSGQTEK